MIIFLLSSTGLCILAVLMIQRGMRVFLKPKRRPYRQTPAGLGLQAEEVSFVTADDITLSAWFVMPVAPTGSGVLMFHGLGSNRADMLLQASSLAKAGHFVLMTDFRNHGASGGDLTTLGVKEVEDVAAAYRYLTARREVDPARIGVVAHSMGAATSLCAAAALVGVRAFVLQAAFATLDENVSRALRIKLGAASLLLRPLFNGIFKWRAGATFGAVRPIDGLAQLADSALLFVHGDKDSYVVPENSRRLYDAFSGQKQLLTVAGASHRSVLGRGYERFEVELLDFLAEHLGDTRALALPLAPAIAICSSTPYKLAEPSGLGVGDRLTRLALLSG